MASFREAYLGNRFVCCALTMVYSIYNTVGRSIPSIYDLGGIYTSALHASVNMSPRVVYIGYGPPYHTIYITSLSRTQFKKSIKCLQLRHEYKMSNVNEHRQLSSPLPDFLGIVNCCLNMTHGSLLCGDSPLGCGG